MCSCSRIGDLHTCFETRHRKGGHITAALPSSLTQTEKPQEGAESLPSETVEGLEFLRGRGAVWNQKYRMCICLGGSQEPEENSCCTAS